MTVRLSGDILYTWLIGGTGIHTRLKISRPLGLAGSNPASATTLIGGKMKTIFNISMCAVAAYFFINWVADNPGDVRKVRNQMNDAVATGKQKVKAATN